MENGTLSASDIALLDGRNGNFGNDGMGFLWIFALLILAGGGFNGFGGYQPQYATQDFVQNGFNFNDLQDQNRDILNAITGGTAQAVAATNQAKYDNINVLKDVQMALASQIADVKNMEQNILGNQNECCCSTKMLIAETGAGINAGLAQNRYENAMNTAAINANTTAQTQKILDALSQNKIETLQAQVNALEMQNALNGVVRYPTNTYYAVPSPCFNGCNCGNI